ncbi:MAG: ankyrin repeat domain-containing protein [Proteobacteria bacterium]|nr:ankyrin repeat domain-containing protein [Pseudomonadota bacterium]MBU1741858.1 ankyrin repeat domain-containing protein [Pseudomonadota bacterium]
MRPSASPGLKAGLVLAALALVVWGPGVQGAKAARGDIFRAIEDGDLEWAQAIVGADRGAVRRPDGRGETPLHWAAQMGRLRIAAFLVKRGAKVSTRNKYRQQPIHMAVWSPKVLVFLIKMGADPNARDIDRLTPLHWAAWLGRTLSVKLLLRHGARTGLKDAEGRTPLDLARQNGHQRVVKLIEAHRARRPAPAGRQRPRP